MKTETSILHVLFPRVRAEILRSLFTTPKEQRYVRELRNMSGLALCTVQDELRKLSAVGLVTSWSDGFHRFYSANPNHPLFSELLRIVQMSARLPRAKHSALRRQQQQPHGRRKRVRRRVPASPMTQPLNWNLFSRADKRSTA
jgi:predicted transcriptional regulator